MTEETNVATTVDEEPVVAVAKPKKAGTRKKAVKDEASEKVKKVPVDLLKDETTPDATQPASLAAVDANVATLAKQVNVTELAQLLRAQIMDDVRAEIAAGTERLAGLIEARNQQTAELLAELRKSKRATIWSKLLKR